MEADEAQPGQLPEERSDPRMNHSASVDVDVVEKRLMTSHMHLLLISIWGSSRSARRAGVDDRWPSRSAGRTSKACRGTSNAYMGANNTATAGWRAWRASRRGNLEEQSQPSGREGCSGGSRAGGAVG